MSNLVSLADLLDSMRAMRAAYDANDRASALDLAQKVGAMFNDTGWLKLSEHDKFLALGVRRVACDVLAGGMPWSGDIASRIEAELAAKVESAGVSGVLAEFLADDEEARVAYRRAVDEG